MKTNFSVTKEIQNAIDLINLNNQNEEKFLEIKETISFEKIIELSEELKKISKIKLIPNTKIWVHELIENSTIIFEKKEEPKKEESETMKKIREQYQNQLYNQMVQDLNVPLFYNKHLEKTDNFGKAFAEMSIGLDSGISVLVVGIFVGFGSKFFTDDPSKPYIFGLITALILIIVFFLLFLIRSRKKKRLKRRRRKTNLKNQK
ncbi:transmembrane protein [Anaeramoeba ignava]|uniref:Transmembrane protein n=1 Tax=Anaeramoeba ignava TaxID=1746090 RepID=A0A9Q0LAJ1_ANAIG|nr:transmembrane protein [Anaeramoeba ignava]